MNKVYFGHTMSPSSAYYRMIGFADKMQEQNLVKYYCYPFEPVKNNNLQNNELFLEYQLSDEKRRQEFCNEFDFLNKKKKVGLYIFQPFSTMWGVSLIDIVHKLYKRPVIAEIDDWAMGVDVTNPNYKSFDLNTERIQAIEAQLEESDAVVCSTEYLKKLYSQYNNNIYVIPNGVDFSVFDRLKNKNKKGIVNIGWEGGSGHDRDLEIIIPVIKKILAKFPNVRFTFLGDAEIVAEQIQDKRLNFIFDWKPVTEYPKLKASLGFDIELAPMVDTNFTRGKSNLRWLEASALKIPVVASNVGEYKGIVGLKCNETEEWVEALSTLIKSPKQRKALAQEAYDKVKKDFNLVGISTKYAKVIDEVIKDQKRRIKNVSTI